MNKYLVYLKKVNNELQQLSFIEGINICWLYIDYIICLITYGCLINQYTKGHFYIMGRLARNRAFTQRRLEKVISLANNRSHIHILENKNEFNKFFSEYVERDWLCSKDMKKESFDRVFNSNEELFIKPLDSQEGEGIRKIKTSTVASDVLYNELKAGNYIIESIIRQHEKMFLGNQSVNTARILTVLDKDGSAHIVRAGLRAGVGDTVVDNFSVGGVLYEIDPVTGLVDHKGIQGDNYNVIYHPGTDICMLGFQLPHWDKAICAVTKAAEKIPQCKFIGWDVAFTNKGVELIEGNHNPGIFTLESIGTPGAYAEVMNILKG